MELVHVEDGRRRRVRVTIDWRSDPTVADLARALGRREAGLVVDGCAQPGDRPLISTGVRRGSEVGDPSPATGTRPSGGTALVVRTGGDAGRRIELEPGAWIVGRHGDLRIDAPSVSRHHCQVIVDHGGTCRLTDLASTNGTRLGPAWVTDPTPMTPGDIAWVGAVALGLGGDERTEVAGLVTGPAPDVRWLNRPPRATPPPAPTVPSPPPPAAPPVFGTRLQLARVAAPLILGSTMAVLTHPRFALFALLTPAVAVATWWSARRRARRENRLSARDFRRRLDEFARAADIAHRAAIDHCRRTTVDLAGAVALVEGPGTRLWERRLDHDDALVVTVGLGALPWRIDLGPEPPAEARAVVAALGPLRDVPVTLDLTTPAGIVGPRPLARALARSLVLQAAALHGPADLGIHVVTDDEGAPDWAWASWLPHHDRPAGPDGGIDLTVVDLGQPGFELLGEVGERLASGSGVVLAERRRDLPAGCRSVVEIVDADGTVTVDGTEPRPPWCVLAGLAPEPAEALARRLAGVADPEAADEAGSLPTTVGLADLLGPLDPSTVADRWRRSKGRHGLAAPIGVGADGPLVVDLVADGPHALVGGTTGSGKSELLRTLVASLAASHDADHLAFVLVDYKGGSAFDACTALPHVVGVVTDLDGHLARRALRSLDAEIHRRERLLRRAEVGDVTAYTRLADQGAVDPLPRLVVVVDEFATLAADLPEFVDALVDVAQRGRSLGIHLVLATQRPAGAIRDSIRTNTNLRVALRLLDDADARDVVAAPEPATIDRSTPGRAYLRFGPGELRLVQTASASLPSTHHDRPPVRLADPDPVGPPTEGSADSDGPGTGTEARTELDVLVEAVETAHGRLGLAAPRRPWLDPLPTRIDLDSLEPPEPDRLTMAYALADHPDRQYQAPHAWTLGTGPLSVSGLAGSGTTSAAVAVVLGAAGRLSPDELHVYAIDAGRGTLGLLEALPHCGAVVPVADHRRVQRLVRRLTTEVARRMAAARRGPDIDPRILVVVDGWPGLVAEFSSARDEPLVSAVRRLITEGTAGAVDVVVTSDRSGGIPSSLVAAIPHRIALRPADATELRIHGIRDVDPAGLVPGRGFDLGTGTELQVGWCADVADAVAGLADRWPPASAPPDPIAELPVDLTLGDMGAPARVVGRPWFVPLGLDDVDLGVAGLELHPGDHALVLGRARSGRSTTLGALAHTLRAAGVAVWAVAPRRSPLAELGGFDEAASTTDEILALVDSAARRRRPGVVLVDDGGSLDDTAGSALAELAEPGDADGAGIHLVVAARPDELKGQYRHWTVALRRSRLGVLLVPDDLDGDLLGAKLPLRRDLPAVPGRGYVVDGGVLTACQVARPDVGGVER